MEAGFVGKSIYCTTVSLHRQRILKMLRELRVRPVLCKKARAEFSVRPVRLLQFPLQFRHARDQEVGVGGGMCVQCALEERAHLVLAFGSLGLLQGYQLLLCFAGFPLILSV